MPANINFGDHAKRVTSFFDEFKAFALKGNVVDLAIGVIIGAAFAGIVKSLVDNIFMPLIGMILRNSVILVDQIETEISDGRPRWDAVVEATLRRFRPIVLTAAATILAMIPIASTVFWGPMAYAIMGGLAIATVLTLVFLPALYVVWYRVKEQ